jgi:hypothetical protein
MIAYLLSSILWVTLIASDLLIVKRLFLMYRKDSDAQKVMFIVGLLTCIPICSRNSRNWQLSISKKHFQLVATSSIAGIFNEVWCVFLCGTFVFPSGHLVSWFTHIRFVYVFRSGYYPLSGLLRNTYACLAFP